MTGSANFKSDVARRSMLLAGASLSIPAWVGAQTATPKKSATAKRSKPMTAAEEAEVARAVADNIADRTGDPPHPAIGTSLKIPNKFKLFDGQDFSESQASGKLLLIYYWASWCPVCKVVSPRLHDFWQKNRSKGVEVLTLSTDIEVQPAFAYIQQRGYKFPTSMAAAAKLGEVMAPRSLPTLMVRSKRGVIVSVDEGEIDADEFKDFLVHL